ncbi:MAG: TolC family protein [Thermodesulfobacteriota bacterium]|jgi:outer membrane protein TolC
MRHLILIAGVWLAVVPAKTAQGELPTGPVLALHEAIEIALSQHPSLRVRQAEVEAARQRVWQQAAGYLPGGGYTYVYSRQQRPVSAAVGGVNVGDGQEQQRRPAAQLFNFHSTNVGLSQVLFDFGRTLDAIRSAQASVEASRADLETTKQTVIFNTKRAYYSALSSQRLLQVAEETVRQNQKHVEEARARFEVGLAPRFDVTQAQVQLSNAILDRVSARNNVALARETLRTAMGVTGPFGYTLVDTLTREPLVFDDEALLSRAYANRPELRGLRARERAAARDVSALRKRYLPSVTGNAQYNWTGREYPLQEGWSWSVTLTFPLFDDILTAARVGEARASLRGVQAQQEDLRQQVALEVRQGLLNVQEAEESIRVSEQVLVQAQENLALAEGRYSAGVGNIIELTDAQVLLTSARANTVQALYAYKTAVAELERAVGQQFE